MVNGEQPLFLYPAALHASSKPCQIQTILGSCIAVCIWDPTTKAGGMNHYMLPLWNGQGLASPKFGNIAIEKLIQRVESFGGFKNKLIAKIFGGAFVIGTKNETFRIGERNIEIAFTILKEIGIPVVAKSVGGDLGRKILFSTETGEVIMKYVKKHAF